MSDTFGAAYAQQYDLLYQDKDYDAEVALLERLFHAHDLEGMAVLDLGCGTGQHAIRLAQRGYDVTGVDRSPEMLRIVCPDGRRKTFFSSPGTGEDALKGQVRDFLVTAE